ncbi:MAG: DUF6677 family protein [Acidobacteriota bacterium]
MLPKNIKAWMVTFCALLFPGLGHLLLGRWVRALLLAAAILLLFGMGLKLEGKLYTLSQEEWIMNLPFLADASIGIPYVLAMQWGYGEGNLQNQSYEYATTFLLVAGLLNLLVCLNCWDLAIGRKR